MSLAPGVVYGTKPQLVGIRSIQEPSDRLHSRRQQYIFHLALWYRVPGNPNPYEDEVLWHKHADVNDYLTVQALWGLQSLTRPATHSAV